MPKRLFGSLALFAALVFASTGCGGSKDTNKSEVTGKVTYNDKPVAGQVVFVTSGGIETSAPIQPDGSYTIINPPTGTMQVYIKPMPGALAGAASPKGGAGGPELSKDMTTVPAGGVQPPAKYTKADSSGLTYEVKAGKQTYDIPLK
jgi:hypothetical protein